MNLSEGDESAIFEKTERLLSVIRFHGIFGIEWLHDKKTGQFYLIDFNARPFSSIGHLTACGLNLPLLAYRELIGDDLAGLEQRPVLKHKYWIDLLRDLRSSRLSGVMGWSDWFRSILRCRSFAYWDWRDPGPGLYRVLQIFTLVMRLVVKKMVE